MSNENADKEILIEKVDLPPIELMKEAKELLGEQYWLFVGMCFVAMLVGSAVPAGILLGPMMCGLYLCYLERKSGSESQFNTLFKGFEHFKEGLIAHLIVIGITMLVTVPLSIVFVGVIFGVMFGLMEDAPAIAFPLIMLSYFLFFLVIIMITTPFVFVFQLIVGHGLTAVPAVKASVAGVRKNLPGMLVLVFAYALIGMLAALACYVPAFLVMPLTIGGFFLAYQRIFPLAKSLKPAKS